MSMKGFGLGRRKKRPPGTDCDQRLQIQTAMLALIKGHSLNTVSLFYKKNKKREVRTVLCFVINKS